MNQLAVLGIILSCTGLAVCFGGQVVLQPFSYSEILKHASNPRAKRQTTLDNVLECTGFIGNVQCTTGLILGVANTYAQCGRNDLATITASHCASNEMGELCASQIGGAITGLVSAFRSCLTEIAPGSTTCSTSCTTALELLRRDLGCCINSVYNVTVEGDSLIAATFAAFTPIFNSSLWDRCFVETVGECANAPSFTPGSRDPPCTDVEAVQAAHTYECTQTNVQPVLDALNRNSTCQLYTTTVVNDCGQRSNGDFCSVDAITNPPTDFLTAVNTNCVSFLTTQSCPGSTCTTAIEQFRDNSGCCVNTNHNTSLIVALGGSLPTSNALWNACGVSSPGFCTSTIVGGSASTDSTTEVGGSASTDKAFDVMLIAIAAAVVKFIF